LLMLCSYQQRLVRSTFRASQRLGCVKLHKTDVVLCCVLSYHIISIMLLTILQQVL
jgi:hypothetical protein